MEVILVPSLSWGSGAVVAERRGSSLATQAWCSLRGGVCRSGDSLRSRGGSRSSPPSNPRRWTRVGCKQYHDGIAGAAEVPSLRSDSRRQLPFSSSSSGCDWVLRGCCFD
ncbi:hypothetical protein LR48_Vigan50s007600 [Vigna angularis]|uniref:Uncharacterized protein n=1 Tax=Phaseolus angularis TaxID=3914 RepID=A0A0L9T476_PHAAN|nr:hypothetical protein LR48_Vigan50s007600 [Vigna angularis]